MAGVSLADQERVPLSLLDSMYKVARETNPVAAAFLFEQAADDDKPAPKATMTAAEFKAKLAEGSLGS